ncbi:winged helix-turn-helix domain-containing protein [Actibacterium sp. 188UL27-1]|nr:winged helix-turn-helix domain-containing protein [Actibacterium sp. 188UL27-1]
MPNNRALDQHILTLRRKIDPDQKQGTIIERVRG